MNTGHFVTLLLTYIALMVMKNCAVMNKVSETGTYYPEEIFVILVNPSRQMSM
jgi:hypothetical protein